MNHTRHLLLMIVCCLVPLVLILIVGVFGFSLGTVEPLVLFALVLLCPVLMIVLMREMWQTPSAETTEASRVPGLDKNEQGAVVPKRSRR